MLSCSAANYTQEATLTNGMKRQGGAGQGGVEVMTIPVVAKMVACLHW